MGGKMSNAYYRDYRATHKKQRAALVKDSMVRCRYAITSEDVQALLQTQDNRCAICKDPFSDTNRPYIDHCHSSGWVRGLLCRDCNFAIGLLKETVSNFQSAVEYLISTAVPTEFNFVAQKDALHKPPSRHRLGVVLSREIRDRISKSRAGISTPAWNKGIPLTEVHKAALRKPKSFVPLRGPMPDSQKESIRKTLKSQVTPESREALRQRAILGAAARWGKVSNAKSGQ